MAAQFDVDIDLPTDFDPSKLFPNWVRASVIRDQTITPHVCGVYPQTMTIDPLSKLAAIPYDIADELRFFKLDLLSRHVYNNFKSREEITELLKLEPTWSLLLVKENVEKLDQLSKHFDLVQRLHPKSIEDLADIIALIRPGKAKLIPLYQAQKETVRKVLYNKTDDYYFKKSHAIAYALIIVLQLHLIELGLL